MKTLKSIVNLCRTIIIFWRGAIVGAVGMYILVLHWMVTDSRSRRKPRSYSDYFKERA